MTISRESGDTDYQSCWEIVSGCRHLADTLRVIGRATHATQSPGASPRERAEAHTMLSVCVQGLFTQAVRLGRAAERMA